MNNKDNMDINYKKQDNHKLFHTLEEKETYGFSQCQNYIPIYDRFFTLSEKNYNGINLDTKYCLHNVTSQDSYNIFSGVIRDSANNKKETKKVYLKYSPLIDPTKYLVGKYDTSSLNVIELPTYTGSEPKSNINTAICKINDYNNAAYVDSFFAYLSSKLLHTHGFIHGVDYYGSYLSIKHDFHYDISDDIEYLQNSTFFHKNNKVLFEMDETTYNEQIVNGDTRNYKKKIVIGEPTNTSTSTSNSNSTSTSISATCYSNKDNNNNNVLTLLDIEDLSEIDTIVNNNDNLILCEPELLFEHNMDKTNKSNKLSLTDSVSCSSRSSNTENDSAVEDNTADNKSNDSDYEDIENDEEEEEEEGNSEEDGSEGSEEGSEDETAIITKIKQFPVNVIALECCENTLDSLMSEENITADIWDSIVMQLLFTLITFQKTFELTHNDLHTNNVMYIKTDQKFLYYKLNHIYYKVPTYGRIFKIIDYGRAIFKFRGKLMCSDSYHQKEGDAATQYNCEPYINTNKPRLDPNFSFDLCRLGCALYDYLTEEPSTPIVKIMMNWCNDDKGRNILYKKNGEERYPDFKLYKMIARTVHKHVPLDVLNNDYFNKFIVSKNVIKMEKVNISMDLDNIPCYTSLPC